MAGSSTPTKDKATVKAKPQKHAVTKSKKKSVKSEDEGQETEGYETDDVEELDSDALDEEDEDFESGKKRKKLQQGQKKRKNTSPRKRRRKAGDGGDSDQDDLPEGQTVVGKVVEAPTEGQVPPGQISQNTLDFLKQLGQPECNDREWFKLHEPVYRQAEKEWKDWIEAFTSQLVEVDDQIPELPPKDVIHRIYRDVRFTNDKTPYKEGFSASFSRTGRKGKFAHYHVSIMPGGRSLVAAGAWQPGRDELTTIRHNILRDPTRLRDVISDPEFVKFFGQPSPHPDGERQSIFGLEDELKKAPKGIDKGHSDIDLLKLRSIAVVHHFLDSEVTDPAFRDTVAAVIKVMRPLVHCLNDIMVLDDSASGVGGTA